jgi:hypothetical protein
VVAYKMQKRLVLDKSSRTPKCVGIALSFRLAHKGQARSILREKLCVWFLVARPHYDADVIDTSA